MFKAIWTEQSWLVRSDLVCRGLLTWYDLAYPLLAAHSPVLCNTVPLLPPTLTLHVYTVCVRTCVSCLCVTSLSSIAGSGPATQDVPRRESLSKPFHTRAHPPTPTPHPMHGDIGCMETSIWRDEENNKKCITFREFTFKNKHVTFSFQIRDIKGSCQSSLWENDGDLNQWRLPTLIESDHLWDVHEALPSFDAT